MAAQYDLQPGLDLSSLASIGQSDIMQALSQAAPLSNIGLVVTQAATASNNAYTPGSEGSPDVPNNARFVRYVWINTYYSPPAIYVYRSSTDRWVQGGIGNGAVNTSKLALDPGSIAIAHMVSDSNGAIIGDGTLSNKALVYDSNGQFIVQISKSDFISGTTLNLSQLNTSGGDATNSFLRYNGGTPAWSSFSPTGDLVNGTVPLAKLAVGSANFLLAANASGIPSYVSNDDSISSFLPAGSPSIGLTVAKLRKEATLTGQVIRYNGSANVWGNDSEIYRAAGITIRTSNGADAGIDHSLGGTPDVVLPFLKNKGTDGFAHGYSSGALIPLNFLISNNAANFYSSPLYVRVNATKVIQCMYDAAGGANLLLRTATGSGFSTAMSMANLSTDFTLDTFLIKFNR